MIVIHTALEDSATAEVTLNVGAGNNGGKSPLQVLKESMVVVFFFDWDATHLKLPALRFKLDTSLLILQ